MIHAIESDTKPVAEVLVVMGSVRAGRLCPQIASWVIDIASAASIMKYELVDLADWPLPMNDEPAIPALGQCLQPHTRAWSEKISAAGGVVFVTPQYNWGYPAVLKNAIDHLYGEWRDKPAMIVTYGGHGGTKCAAQLRQVAEAVHMRPAATMPAITLTRAMMGGGPIVPAEDFKSEARLVQQAIRELSDSITHL
jgi:NAD(P)H-dependent FMN reductase